MRCYNVVLTMDKMGTMNIIRRRVIYMANTNVTMRIDETLKAQLQELCLI